jgi:hypothetical protein
MARAARTYQKAGGAAVMPSGSMSARYRTRGGGASVPALERRQGGSLLEEGLDISRAVDDADDLQDVG